MSFFVSEMQSTTKLAKKPILACPDPLYIYTYLLKENNKNVHNGLSV